jgi:putative pyruvate formate lyase activating enzyme
MPRPPPAYRSALESGLLRRRADPAARLLRRCRLCPRRCRVDRLAGGRGYCRGGALAEVAAAHPHFGEEAPLVGRGGSGTIFFAGCSLGCRFCQNWEISRGAQGRPVDPGELAAMMLDLQARGCANINLVTPTHVVPQILAALLPAAEGGLAIPLVYNCGGYERRATLRLLDGLVDIYLPDFKFWDPAVAARLCDAPDYPAAARSALLEMQRQVGELRSTPDGLAFRGLLVRHLVMPGGLAGSAATLDFIARRISPRTAVNIMPQYRPCGQATRHPELARPVTPGELFDALLAARSAGLSRLTGW